MRRYMSKRQRPCDFCRSRKAACRLESTPPCRLCALHNRPCTFIEAAPVRKKTGVETQALNDSTSKNGSPQDDESQPIENTQSPSRVQGLGPESSMAFDASMQFLEDLEMGEANFDFMFQMPQSPAVQLPIASPPTTILNAVLDGSGTARPQLLGLTSDMDPFLLQHYRTNERGMTQFKQLAIQPVQTHPFPAQFLFSQPSIFIKGKEEAGLADGADYGLKEELEQIVSLDAGKRLISLYDRFIAPQCPVFSSLARPDPVSSPAHLLAAVYAVAFPFSMHDDKLCIELAYDAPPYAALSRIINSSLPSELHSPSLSTVQTLILMVFRPSSNPLVSDASWRWTILGILVTTSINLGLHLDSSSWSLVPEQVSHRRRLSFLVYAIDKWLAATLGRPPQVRDDNWLVTSLSQVDELGCSLDEEEWAALMEFSSLTQVLDATITKLYSLKAIHSVESSNEAPGLLRDLYGVEPASKAAPEMTHWLGYSYIKILILRASLRPFIGDDRSTGLEDANSTKETLEILMNDVVKHIKTLTTDEMNGYWPPWCQTALSSFWFTGLHMACLSSDTGEASRWIMLLADARKELRLKANSLNVLRLGLLRIDSIFWRGVENVIHLEPHVLEAFKLAQTG